MNEIKKYFSIIKLAIQDFLLDLRKMINKDLYKRRNIVEANISVGLHHLLIGNINDAIFRFYLVSKLLDAGNKKALYLLAWSYLLKRDMKKSIAAIENCKEEDDKGLGQYLSNYKSYDFVPGKIIDKYQDFTYNYIYKRYFSKTMSLSKLFVDDLLAHIKVLSKDFRLLDIGCKSGLIGAELDHVMNKKYIIHGLESNKNLCKKAEELSNASKVKIYDDVIESEIEVYLNNSNLQYDSVIAFDSLSYTKNLTSLLTKIKNILKKTGCLILLLKKAEITQISDDLVSFEYREDYVISQLSSAGFSIHNVKTYKIRKHEEYFVIIAS
jgi:SAM-dependent methyltransferase